MSLPRGPNKPFVKPNVSKPLTELPPLKSILKASQANVKPEVVPIVDVVSTSGSDVNGQKVVNEITGQVYFNKAAPTPLEQFSDDEYEPDENTPIPEQCIRDPTDKKIYFMPNNELFGIGNGDFRDDVRYGKPPLDPRTEVIVFRPMLESDLVGVIRPVEISEKGVPKYEYHDDYGCLYKIKVYTSDVGKDNSNIVRFPACSVFRYRAGSKNKRIPYKLDGSKIKIPQGYDDRPYNDLPKGFIASVRGIKYKLVHLNANESAYFGYRCDDNGNILPGLSDSDFAIIPFHWLDDMTEEIRKINEIVSKTLQNFQHRFVQQTAALEADVTKEIVGGDELDFLLSSKNATPVRSPSTLEEEQTVKETDSDLAFSDASADEGKKGTKDGKKHRKAHNDNKMAATATRKSSRLRVKQEQQMEKPAEVEVTHVAIEGEERDTATEQPTAGGDELATQCDVDHSDGEHEVDEISDHQDEPLVNQDATDKKIKVEPGTNIQPLDQSVDNVNPDVKQPPNVAIDSVMFEPRVLTAQQKAARKVIRIACRPVTRSGKGVDSADVTVTLRSRIESLEKSFQRHRSESNRKITKLNGRLDLLFSVKGGKETQYMIPIETIPEPGKSSQSAGLEVVKQEKLSPWEIPNFGEPEPIPVVVTNKLPEKRTPMNMDDRSAIFLTSEFHDVVEKANKILCPEVRIRPGTDIWFDLRLAFWCAAPLRSLEGDLFKTMMKQFHKFRVAADTGATNKRSFLASLKCYFGKEDVKIWGWSTDSEVESPQRSTGRPRRCIIVRSLEEYKFQKGIAGSKTSQASSKVASDKPVKKEPEVPTPVEQEREQPSVAGQSKDIAPFSIKGRKPKGCNVEGGETLILGNDPTTWDWKDITAWIEKHGKVDAPTMGTLTMSDISLRPDTHGDYYGTPYAKIKSLQNQIDRSFDNGDLTAISRVIKDKCKKNSDMKSVYRSLGKAVVLDLFVEREIGVIKKPEKVMDHCEFIVKSLKGITDFNVQESILKKTDKTIWATFWIFLTKTHTSVADRRDLIKVTLQHTYKNRTRIHERKTDRRAVETKRKSTGHTEHKTVDSQENRKKHRQSVQGQMMAPDIPQPHPQGPAVFSYPMYQQMMAQLMQQPMPGPLQSAFVPRYVTESAATSDDGVDGQRPSTSQRKVKKTATNTKRTRASDDDSDDEEPRKKTAKGTRDSPDSSSSGESEEHESASE